MIRISTEKGLVVRLTDYQELLERPGFQIDLNPKAVKLDSVIGAYLFKEPVKCGFSTCHQPHNRGFVITTKDGFETNIGKDCGRKYFGVDFKTMADRHTREAVDQDRRELLENWQNRLPPLIDELDALWHGERGPLWISRLLPELEPYVHDMIRSRSNAVQIVRQATEQEIEDQEEITRTKLERPHYISETVGQLEGMSVFNDENSFDGLAVFRSGLRQLAGLEIPSLARDQLRYWSKWAGQIDVEVSRYRNATEQGRRLLTKANLYQLLQTLPTKTQQNAFKRAFRGLP